MGNHCIDCSVCGDCLLCGDGNNCKWSGCPGWIIGNPEDLNKIAEEHPNAEIRAKAAELARESETPQCTATARKFSDLAQMNWERAIDCGPLAIHKLGFSTTTNVFTLEAEDGAWEARVGFSVMAHTNMNEEEYQKAHCNPFHPEFHDNFSSAEGPTKDQAIANLDPKLESLSELFFA